MDAIFSKPLSAATTQEIQLELIRRTRFNAFDGERVVASLLAHRDLWEAVMIDRLCFAKQGKLPADGLLKLRDLPDGIWNVDTLYVLTRDAGSARTLARLAEEEDWGGMVHVHTDSQNIDDALGASRSTEAVVSIWWD